MERRTIALIIVLVVTVVLLGVVAVMVFRAPGSQETKPQAPRVITVVDFSNRTVEVPVNASRVVAIGPGVLRLVAYLGALDKIVGVEDAEKSWSPLGRDYAMAYGDVFKNLQVIGPGGPRNPPNPELLRSVKPDIVLMSRVYVDLYDPDRLSQEVGAPVVVIDYGVAGYLNVTEFKRAITLLGRILGREARAQELAKYIDGVVDDLAQRVRVAKVAPSVYVGAVSYKGAQPFTGTQGMFPPLQLLKTRSIVDELGKKGFVNVDFEYILKKNPEYIFIDLNNLQTVLDDYKKDSAKYCALGAFKEGRVYALLPFNYYHTNVATALADAYFMGKVLYPEQFKDVDPAKKADEIYRVFLGKPLYEEFVRGFGRGFGSLSDLFKC
ncbi:ABC transporter substrate-binding protein [Thermofilum sp.]|uniref:ABC transporter substrate-binding protein n=1 Tax=Thermofilum sp. TaxID=1961369 RepID=UPI00258A261A|nr:ABC transporter substrate-binding protein [Thermofilum sp.]